MSDGKPHALLNAWPEERARAALKRCCGAERWVAGVLDRRPFASDAELFLAAEEVWASLGRDDYLEAFTHHPKIGASVEELRRRFATTATLSAGEQASVARATEETLAALRDGNLAYEARFGFIFIVCATGKSATEMLQALRERLPNEPSRELAIAAAEQAKITRLRLEKLTA